MENNEMCQCGDERSPGISTFPAYRSHFLLSALVVVELIDGKLRTSSYRWKLLRITAFMLSKGYLPLEWRATAN